MRKNWIFTEILILFIIVLFIGGILIFLLEHQNENENKNKNFIPIQQEYGYSVILDKETGVAYIITREGHTTPLYNSDGSLKIYEIRRN